MYLAAVSLLWKNFHAETQRIRLFWLQGSNLSLISCWREFTSWFMLCEKVQLDPIMTGTWDWCIARTCSLHFSIVRDGFILYIQGSMWPLTTLNTSFFLPPCLRRPLWWNSPFSLSSLKTLWRRTLLAVAWVISPMLQPRIWETLLSCSGP